MLDFYSDLFVLVKKKISTKVEHSRCCVISNNLNLVMLCVIGGGRKYFVSLQPLIPSIFKI